VFCIISNRAATVPEKPLEFGAARTFVDEDYIFAYTNLRRNVGRNDGGKIRNVKFD
jgi:hypothetical protein